MTVSTKILPPPPPEFCAVFVEKGWRGLERMYGARDDRLVKWLELSGRDRLNGLRRRYLGGDRAALAEVQGR